MAKSKSGCSSTTSSTGEGKVVDEETMAGWDKELEVVEGRRRRGRVREQRCVALREAAGGGLTRGQASQGGLGLVRSFACSRLVHAFRRVFPKDPRVE